MKDVQTLIEGVANAAQGGTYLGSVVQGWEMALGAALIASVMILTFIYIIGVLLRNQNAVSFVKLELYELAVSAILAGVIIALVVAAAALKVGFIVPFSDNKDLSIYAATEKYYQDVGERMIGFMTTDYYIGSIMDNLASATPYSRPLGVGLVAAPLAGLATPIKQILYNVNTALAIGFIINAAQAIVFKFAVFAFLQFYLPLGVLLRSFTPTRRIGGVLIAIALGFLFILPITAMMSAEVATSSNSPLIGIANAEGIIWAKYIQPGAANSTPTGMLKGMAQFLWSITGGALINLGTYFKGALAQLFAFALMLPLTTVGISFAIAYLLPALHVLILVQAVKEMSKALGEEVDITTLTRMI